MGVTGVCYHVADMVSSAQECLGGCADHIALCDESD